MNPWLAKLFECDPTTWRGINSWVCWGSGEDAEVVRVRWLAQAIGAKPAELLDWLQFHCPPTGGRLGGRPVRWASPEEARIAERNPPIWAAVPGNTYRVLWRHPDGKEELLILTDAGRRLIRNGKHCQPEAVRELLCDAPLRIEGHLLRLVDAYPYKPSSRRRPRAGPAGASVAKLDDYRPDSSPTKGNQMSEQQQQAPAAEKAQIQVRRRGAPRKAAAPTISPEVVALVQAQAEERGVTPDTMILASLPTSAPLQLVIDQCGDILGELTDADLVQLRAIAAVTSARK